MLVTYKIKQNTPKYIKIHQNTPKYIKIHQNTPKNIKIHQNTGLPYGKLLFWASCDPPCSNPKVPWDLTSRPRRWIDHTLAPSNRSPPVVGAGVAEQHHPVKRNVASIAVKKGSYKTPSVDVLHVEMFMFRHACLCCLSKLKLKLGWPEFNLWFRFTWSVPLIGSIGYSQSLANTCKEGINQNIWISLVVFFRRASSLTRSP